MTWVFAVVVVVLIGVTAVVAAGRGGGLVEVPHDRPDPGVPADGPLTAAHLREVRFSTALRGYRTSEVDALLDRLAAQLDPPAAPGLPGASAPGDPGEPGPGEPGDPGPAGHGGAPVPGR